MTWNLKRLYTSDNDPQIDIDIREDTNKITLFANKWKNNKDYTYHPGVLRNALDELESLSQDINKPYYYFLLRKEQDQTDGNIKERFNKIVDIYTKLENNILFFELNIAKISKSKQAVFLKSEALREYKHHLEQIFASSKYLLSEKEETVFNLLGKVSHSNWSDMLSELLDKQVLNIIDENNNELKISYNEVSKYLNSFDKNVREIAGKEFDRVNSKYLEIAEFEINSILESKKISDDYRKINRPDETRHLSDDIESDVVDTLLETISSHFDISQRYYKIKAKMLSQNKLRYHERNIPVTSEQQIYDFPESISLVKKVFGNLDTEFKDIVKKFEKEGSYDVFPREGKSGGAFCINISKSLPTYILLNHTGRLNDVLTIAHESGHGIHAELSNCQNQLNSGHPISLAEVASTFFEDFVLDDILSNSDDDELKKSILMEKLNGDISSIFRQVAFYNFEKDLHKSYREKGFLSKEFICELFCKHMKSYLGDAVEVDDGMRYGWMYVSHFRRFFYVYSYASGLLISKGLQSLVRDDKKNIQKIKEFLKSGSTLSPKDVFKKIDIDITNREFWERGLKEMENNLNNLS